MTAIIRLPSIHAGRYRAVKLAVHERCHHLGLCAEASERCTQRAARLLREGRSAATAIADGIRLAKRLAGHTTHRNAPDAA